MSFKLNDWAYRGSNDFYDRKLRQLAANELPPEKWDYTGDASCKILRNYLFYTFDKLWVERENASEEIKNEFIYESDSGACFNTGLLDKNMQPVYFYCEPNGAQFLQKWIFRDFCNSFTVKYLKIAAQEINKLRRANYFYDPSSNGTKGKFNYWYHFI